MTAPPEDDPLGRGRMPLGKRVDLLERDRAQQSRVLTELVNASKTFTPEQIAQLRAVMVDVLGDAGLRLDDADHQGEAREDFRFLRGLRNLKDGVATKIGNAIITALIVIAFAIVGSGFWQWISTGGK